MLSRFHALNSGLRSDRGSIQRSTARLATSSALSKDDRLGLPRPLCRSFQRVVGEFANEHFPLDTVPEHVILEAQSFQGNPRCTHSPIRPLAEAVLVRVRMADVAKIVAKLCEQAIRNMKMAPAAGVTDGLEVFDAAKL